MKPIFLQLNIMYAKQSDCVISFVLTVWKSLNKRDNLKCYTINESDMKNLLSQQITGTGRCLKEMLGSHL